MKYHELSDEQKARARDWLRELTFTDSSEWEHIYEDATAVAALMGITIRQHPAQTVGGTTHMYPNIYFQMHVQGSGASFDGTYRYQAGMVEAVQEYAPTDKKLHHIVRNLEAVQRTRTDRLRAEITVAGHYVHSGGMSVEVMADDDQDVDEATEIVIRDCMRAFADWIYRRLEAEYDYQTSDEALEAAIEANDYDFTPRETLADGIII